MGNKAGTTIYKWQKTRFPGVRFREHGKRRHGKMLDRYFSIRYQVDGKRREEGLGWMTEGWTAEKAADQLASLKRAGKTGEGPASLKEKRKEKKKKEAIEKAAKEKEKKDRITFKEFFLDTYFPISKTSKKSESFSKENAHFRLWIDPLLGEKPIKEISPFDLERLKNNVLSSGKSPRYLQYIFATFRQAWNLARRRGIVSEESPTKHVKIPKFDNRRQRFLSIDEAQKLLDKLKEKDQQVWAMTIISLHMGFRASEIFNLTWGDIDLEKEMVLVKDGKGGRSRFGYMTSTVKGLLTALPQGKAGDLVFPNCKGGAHTEIPRVFRETADDLFNDGITDRRDRVSFHTCRHTFASWHAMGGTDIIVLKELLGHSVIAMTMRYSHLSPGALQEAQKKIEILSQGKTEHHSVLNNKLIS